MNISDQSTRYRFVIAGLLIWANFAFGLNFVSMAPILPIISDDYGISHTLAGLLIAVIFIIEGIFGLPGGIIVGWLGQRRAYTISLFMMGTATLTALSPSFEGLMALRVVYSLGIALFFPATAPLIMQWFQPKVIPLVYGVGTSSIMVGFAVSGILVAPMSDIIGWETVLGAFGAVGLGVAVAWVFLGKTQASAQSTPSKPTLVWGEIWTVVRNRTIILVTTAEAAVFTMYFGLASWLPTFYEETRGWSLTQGGLIISILPLVGIFAVILGGSLPMKIESKRLFFIVPGVMVGLGSMGTFLVDNTVITYLSAVVLGLGAYMFVPLALTMPMQIPGMTPQRIALFWGWQLTVVGIGEFIAPLTIGAMKDAFGTFIPGFLVFAALGCWLFFAGILLPKSSAPEAPDADPSATVSPVQEEPAD